MHRKAVHAATVFFAIMGGLSLRAAAERLEIRCMSVQRAQKKAMATLRQQLTAGG